jgi:hypothetical protein
MNILDKLHKLLDPVIVAKNIDHLHYLARVNYWKAIKPEMPDPIFIIGCSRAGTTVTFETIRTSSRLISFHYEIPEFWEKLAGPWDQEWESECAGIEQALPEHRNEAFAHFYARLGRGWVLDKTCINILRIPYLHALFPDAYFIYLHRDGRDNINSLMEGWRQRGRFELAQTLGQLPEKVAINSGEFQDWCFFLPPQWRDYNMATLSQVCAHQWITANSLALAAKKTIPQERWIQLRYEDIFTQPIEMFEQVFERLRLPFEEKTREYCRTLNQRPTSIVSGPPQQEKWRQQNPNEIAQIAEKIQHLQAELGYV